MIILPPELFSESVSIWITVSFLLAVLLWTYVYFTIVRNALKFKYVGMPFFALCLNITWEFITSYWGGIPENWHGQNVPESLKYGAYLYRIWFLFDLVMLVFMVKFGASQFNFPKARNYFIYLLPTTILSAYLTQYYFIINFEPQILAPISAYIINLVMSVCFVGFGLKNYHNYNQRGIAVAKLFGTLLFTVLYCAQNLHSNTFEFVLTCGSIIAILDFWYILLTIKGEKQDEKELV